MIEGPRAETVPTRPVVRAVDLLGDRLTVSILRDAFVERARRFGDWARSTGASPAVLSSRLRDLVEHGLLERRSQQGHPHRSSYLLTPLGLATWSFLVSIWTWEREWSAAGALQPELIHRPCGRRGTPDLVCASCSRTVRAQDVSLVMDPAQPRLSARVGRRRSRRAAGATAGSDLQFTAVMEAIGDPWSIQVTGLALSGVCRFADFQGILGASPSTLSERLARLCDEGILRRAQGERDYRLTPRGRALFPIFAFLMDWTRTAHPELAIDQLGPQLWHPACGSWLVAALQCRGCGELLQRADVLFD